MDSRQQHLNSQVTCKRKAQSKRITISIAQSYQVGQAGNLVRMLQKRNRLLKSINSHRRRLGNSHHTIKRLAHSIKFPHGLVLGSSALQTLLSRRLSQCLCTQPNIQVVSQHCRTLYLSRARSRSNHHQRQRVNLSSSGQPQTCSRVQKVILFQSSNNNLVRNTSAIKTSGKKIMKKCLIVILVDQSILVLIISIGVMRASMQSI